MSTAPFELWGGRRMRQKVDAGELLPTWQIGQEQFPLAGLKTYFEQGYSHNSLIYACIREIATSFASIDPQLKRIDGKPVKKHRMLDIVNDPNTHQDRYQFTDLLITQFEAAGNAYIQKVRVSDDAARRVKYAGYPVQELELVRPDYVSIEPGVTRTQDVFVVRIGGTVRARIPRADMIHIKEPNLINDFYGLPKMSVLLQEGSIDAALSSYELAFFRNAGVPMGILKVKGKTKQEEIAEIKSRFHSAYNGLRKWFDLLVLNSDEASYEQLGLNQSDMEADSTRFHAESRICAVFGVPPIVVGARLAYMSNTGGVQYDQAQFQFWSETLVPLARTIGGAFEHGLLPEFALIADEGAEFTYDFSEVRALQESISQKLREVDRMVLTGAFTRDQALGVVSLPAIDAEDFYIRNANQVIVALDGTVTPMAPSAGGQQTPNADNPLVGAAAIDEAETIIKQPRCSSCNKLVAHALGHGSSMDCPRCGTMITA